MGDLTQIRARDVEEALNALTKVVQKFNETKKKQALFDEEDAIFLQICLDKIPPLDKYKFYKIKLPHSLFSDSSTICLFVGDVDRKSREVPDEDHPIKIFFRENNIDAITEVITLRELRTEYKPFEAKRNLCHTFDLFLADRRIKECLPRLLGKTFFQKRKVPFSVTVKEDVALWEKQLASILSQSVLYVSGRGTSCVLQVGNKKLTKSQILDNIKAAIMQLHKESGLDIIGLNLKMSRSIAIPLYQSFKQPPIQEKEKPSSLTEIDDDTLMPKAEAAITAKKPIVREESIDIKNTTDTPKVNKKVKALKNKSKDQASIASKKAIVKEKLIGEGSSTDIPKENKHVKALKNKVTKKRKADAVIPIKAKKRQVS